MSFTSKRNNVYSLFINFLQDGKDFDAYTIHFPLGKIHFLRGEKDFYQCTNHFLRGEKDFDTPEKDFLQYTKDFDGYTIHFFNTQSLFILQQCLDLFKAIYNEN